MKAGSKVVAKKDMVVRDIEDSSIPPVKIKKGDIGTVKGWGDYDQGRAIEINIHDTEIFLYPQAIHHCFEVVEK